MKQPARLIRAPTADAKWCLEQFFLYLELNVKNRVAAKTGRSHSLELTKLSNIMANAAVVHAVKARTLLSSSRARKGDMDVSITPHQKSKMREVFIYYCGWADKGNYMYMSRAQFLRFARDAHLVGGSVDMVSLSLLFDKIHLESPEQTPGVRISLLDWQRALLAVATKLYPELEPQAAFNKIQDEHVLLHTEDQALQEDPLAVVVLQPEVIQVLDEAKPKLKPIFKFYVQQQDFGNAEDVHASWQDVQTARSHMPFEAFNRFAQDFELIPDRLNRAQLAEAFQRARFGPTGDTSSEDLLRIGFEEFIDAIARCALMMFNYQVPKTPAPIMDFKASYHTDAKRLWLLDAQQQLDTCNHFPDEVVMPRASLEEAIGGDDCAHVDVVSRAASRAGGLAHARSIAQYRTKVRAGPGIEMMAVHNEIDSLLEDKPLHLRGYTPEWVGRSGLPLNETAKLKQRKQDPLLEQGIYHNETHLPPKYRQRMVDMLEARCTREQRLEALRLCYMAERRQQQQAGLQQSATRRQRLQLASRQSLDCEDANLTTTSYSCSMPLWFDAMMLGCTGSSGSSPDAGGRSSSARAILQGIGSSKACTRDGNRHNCRRLPCLVHELMAMDGQLAPHNPPRRTSTYFQ